MYGGEGEVRGTRGGKDTERERKRMRERESKRQREEQGERRRVSNPDGAQ